VLNYGFLEKETTMTWHIFERERNEKEAALLITDLTRLTANLDLGEREKE
jgi:hypothetical protein